MTCRSPSHFHCQLIWLLIKRGTHQWPASNGGEVNLREDPCTGRTAVCPEKNDVSNEGLGIIQHVAENCTSDALLCSHLPYKINLQLYVYMIMTFIDIALLKPTCYLKNENKMCTTFKQSPLMTSAVVIMEWILNIHLKNELKGKLHDEIRG